MAIERTLVILKPDAVQRKLCGKIISMLEEVNLNIIAAKLFKPDAELLRKHYPDTREYIMSLGQKNFGATKVADEVALKQGQIVHDRLMNYMSDGRVMAMVIEGNDAIKVVRKLCGTTNPVDAVPGTIRGRFASDSYELSNAEGRAIRNLMHASGDAAEAKTEIELWFEGM